MDELIFWAGCIIFIFFMYGIYKTEKYIKPQQDNEYSISKLDKEIRKRKISKSKEKKKNYIKEHIEDAADILVTIENQPLAQIIEKEKKKRQKERKREYNEYLNTPKWKKIKKEAHVRDEGKCQMCKHNVWLSQSDCHHLHYRNFKFEKLEDVVTTCKFCHDQLHKYHGKNAINYPLLSKEQIDKARKMT